MIPITLKVQRKFINLNIEPELEPYFRTAAKIINQRIEDFGKTELDGEKDLEYFAYTVAIEGMMKAQVFHDKYELLKKELENRLNDLDTRLSFS